MADAISYIDTSALIKWYIREAASDEVAIWIEAQSALAFSRLGWLELRCAMNRRVRIGSLPGPTASEALRRFVIDVEAGVFTLLPLNDQQALTADALIARLAHPLRTLDALHLAAANAQDAACIGTADRVVKAAAESLGISVAYFGNP